MDSADRNIEYASTLSAEGRIGNTSNLDGKPIFIFSALDDEVVDKKYQQFQKDFFDHYKSNVEFVTMEPLGHWLPSVFEQSSELGPRDG